MALPPSPGNSHCTVTRSQQATAATACQRRRHHGSRRRPGSIPFPLVLVLLAYKPSSTSGQASSSSPTTAAPPPEAPPQAISYADYYPTPADRPNSCAEVWRSPAAAATASNTTHQPGAHIPFLGEASCACPGLSNNDTTNYARLLLLTSAPGWLWGCRTQARLLRATASCCCCGWPTALTSRSSILCWWCRSTP
jgi:hypothetical protein